MSAANYLVRWSPNIVEATADDIARFGPNAAQVRGLLNYLSTESPEAYSIAKMADWGDGIQDAWDAVYVAARGDARSDAINAAWDDTWGAGKNAAAGEVVSDLISPENYRILTNPLNVGRTLQERMGLMLPDQKGPFMQMINQLRPASVEDILAIDRLNSSPNVDALFEMLAGMAEGQPLARRIKAAETMYRSGRGGRGMA